MHSKERSADSNSDHSDTTTSAVGHHFVVDLNVSLRAAGTPSLQGVGMICAWKGTAREAVALGSLSLGCL